MEVNRGVPNGRPPGHVWAYVAVAAFAFCPQARAQQITAGLQITSPAGGTVVHPGDTITVTVAPLAGVNPSFVGLLAQFPIEVSACPSQPCYQFTLTVPPTIVRAGPYSINAIGAAGTPGAGSVVASGAENLDIEPSSAITNLNVSLPFLVFHHSGSRSLLTVRGGFADGTSMDITESTEIEYASSDTNVATVSPDGVVTAVGTGCEPGGACVGVCMINVQYGGKTVMVQVSTSALKDTSPPTTTASVSPTPNAAGWNNSDVTVTLDATDTGGTSPSGVQQISYSAAGAQTIASTSITGSSTTFTIGTEGTTTITFSATDNAGNIEPNQTLVVNLDKTPPAVNCDTADTQWHATDVSIACTASDSLSGLAQSAQASFSLSTSVPQGTETANASTNSLSICDVAGNCLTAGPITGIMVDKKPPTITITTPSTGNPTYLLNQAIATNYSCSDGGSGVATCSGTVPTGNNLNTSSVGTQNFVVNSADKVGNASNLSAGYSVSYNICALYDQTKAVESNATIPVRFYLCDANQADVSSSSIAVNLTGIQQISTSTSGVIVTYPAATPDANFRYSSDLGPGGGYIMNVSTKGFAAGTYQVTFTVANDPIPHSLLFEVTQ